MLSAIRALHLPLPSIVCLPNLKVNESKMAMVYTPESENGEQFSLVSTLLLTLR